MITESIPGFSDIAISHLVLDYNGTLALDGVPLVGVRERIESLSEHLTVHVVTADTFGRAAEALAEWPVFLTVLTPGQEADQKATYVQTLGSDATVAVGNGRNDCRMLSLACVGMAVTGPEGAASPALLSADITCPDIFTALDLLLHPNRLKATLRS
ncbi:HAD family hydrolase [Desulfoluna spongiiphila]|uniref:ATPase, P-type (Transporting), HAD superfamily, subfamily IC n=1 Tax=Desulfoluna spongiiphila TaxID=419481 RepID=A0A1G5I7D2_9BACT|nr:HAD family hydrolase [Desulfoluna spongiiphila]SCY72055.1 ATPase, P-type (transporting), HAD superfamily, subfamily IC [Desulfoluna spongiiphila]VVS93226.1 had superfamily [Desulfoluna spongiiphila]